MKQNQYFYSNINSEKMQLYFEEQRRNQKGEQACKQSDHVIEYRMIRET